MNLVTDKSIASLGGKLWIQSEHLYGKGNLVRDSLAGAVSTGKKLQVLNPIIASNPVDMVHGFFRSKQSTNVLFHYPSVLKHMGLFSGFGVAARDSKRDVPASLQMGFVLTGSKPLIGQSGAKNRPAFRAAKFSNFADSISAFALKKGWFAAHDAGAAPLVLGNLHASIGAFAGAILWFLALPNLFVRSPLGFGFGAFLAATGAVVCNSLDLLFGWSTVNSFVSSVAFAAAKLALLARSAMKIQAALLAAHKHVYLLVEGEVYQCHAARLVSISHPLGV